MSEHEILLKKIDTCLGEMEKLTTICQNMETILKAMDVKPKAIWHKLVIRDGKNITYRATHPITGKIFDVCYKYCIYCIEIDGAIVNPAELPELRTVLVYNSNFSIEHINTIKQYIEEEYFRK